MVTVDRGALELLHVVAWGVLVSSTALGVFGADSTVELLVVTAAATVGLLAWYAVGDHLGLGERGEAA